MDLIEKVINYLDTNADEWEIYFAVGRSKSATVEKGRIRNISEGIESVYSVRVILNGKLGFASSNSADNLLEVSDKAVKISRISEEKLDEFPEGGMSRVDGIYDRKFDEIDSLWIKEAVEKMVNSFPENVNPAVGAVEVGKRIVRIINSSGAELESKATSCVAFIEAVVEDSSGFEMFQSRMFDLDFEKVGEKASELALRSLKAEKIGRVECDVVLSPVAISQLFFFTLYPAFSAENIAKGRSMLAGRIGESFGEFTLIDDGTLEKGLATSPFDDEALPTKKTIIFEDGIFKNPITDFRFSKILNIKPTGNGFREEATSYPRTSPSNVVIDFPYKSKDIYDDAFIVNSFIGAHTSNPVSGDFSLECQNSFLNGKPVKSAMLYGNVYELLKKIEVIGKDVRQVDNTVSPSIRFSNLSVGGQY